MFTTLIVTAGNSRVCRDSGSNLHNCLNSIALRCSNVCVWSPPVDWVFGIFHWLSPYADDTLMLWYRKGIGRMELRNTMQFDTQTWNRMKNIWVFLIFNVLSTFRSDTPKANCQNKEIKRAGKMLSASVRSHFGGLSNRIPQKLSVDVILW